MRNAKIFNAAIDVDDAVIKKHTQNADTALGPQSEDLDMNTHKIVGVVDPTSNQHATTKKYVDDLAGPGAGYWVNVEDYGVGTGETGADNQTYLTAVITGISNGDVVVIPPGVYTVTGNWTISKACTVFAYGAKLDFATNAANQGIVVTADNVRIFGLELEGPQYVASNGTQRGIYAYGTNNSPAAPTYITGLRVKDCYIHDWGHATIRAKYIEDFYIENSLLENIYYGGIVIESGKRGWIKNNKVYNIPSPAGGGIYGIAATRVAGAAQTLTAEPRSESIVIDSNRVEGVTNWEGIDTHAGKNIKIINNTVIDCKLGIMAGSDLDSHGFKNVLISGNNVINNSIAAGTVIYGITAVGDCNNAVKSENAILTDNYVYGHGDNDVASGCAVYVHTIDKVEIGNNVIENSGAHAIRLSLNTTNFNIHNNIIDTITSSGITPYGIYTGTGTNSGIIAHNRLDIGSVAGIKLGSNEQTITLFRNDITTSGTRYVNPEYAKDIIDPDWPSCVFAEPNADDDIPDITNTTIQFDNEGVDGRNEFAAYTFTPKVDGDYQINAQVQFLETFNAGNLIVLGIFDGATLKSRTKVITEAGEDGCVTTSQALRLTNASTITIKVYHDYGAGRTIDATYCRLSIIKINS